MKQRNLLFFSFFPLQISLHDMLNKGIGKQFRGKDNERTKEESEEGRWKMIQCENKLGEGKSNNGRKGE